MEKTITVLPGDGIGPEVTQAAVKVLQAVAHRFNHTFNLQYALIGGAAIDAVVQFYRFMMHYTEILSNIF